MMLDRPIRWDETIDKEKTLDYVFAHQRLTQANDAMLAQYGASREDLIGLTPYDFYKHDLNTGRQVWRRFLDAGRLHVDTDERKLDGTPIWIEGDYICLYDDQGRITGHFGVQHDITQRKQTDTLLKIQRDLGVTLRHDRSDRGLAGLFESGSGYSRSRLRRDLSG